MVFLGKFSTWSIVFFFGQLYFSLVNFYFLILNVKQTYQFSEKSQFQIYFPFIHWFIQDVKNEGESYRDANFHKNKKEEIEKVFLPSFDAMASKFEELITAYNNLKAISGVSGVSIEIELLKESLAARSRKLLPL